MNFPLDVNSQAVICFGGVKTESDEPGGWQKNIYLKLFNLFIFDNFRI